MAQYRKMQSATVTCWNGVCAARNAATAMRNVTSIIDARIATRAKVIMCPPMDWFGTSMGAAVDQGVSLLNELVLWKAGRRAVLTRNRPSVGNSLNRSRTRRTERQARPRSVMLRLCI